MPDRSRARNFPEEVRSAAALERIASCLAYLAVQSGELKGRSDNDLIPVLASWGFDKTAIASILHTTPERVRVRLAQLKGSRKRKEEGAVPK